MTRWLSCLFGKKWPIKTPPTVQSVTQSVLKKQPNSIEKDLVILRFLNDEYSPLCVFMVKSELRCSQPPTAVKHMSDNDILRTVNQDLCRELMDLKVKNETLNSAQEDVNVCFALKCYGKHQTKRQHYFTTR